MIFHTHQTKHNKFFVDVSATPQNCGHERCFNSSLLLVQVAISFFLVLMSSLISAEQRAVTPKDPALVHLYELSQSSVIIQNATEKRGILKAIGQTMGGNKYKGGDAILDGVLIATDMNSLARQYLAENWDSSKASRAVNIFNRVPHSTLLALEAAAGSSAHKDDLRAYFQNPGASMSESRVALISEIDELVLATEWMSTFLDILASALEPRIKAMATAGKMSNKESDAAVAQLEQQASDYRASMPGTLFLLYAYRNVSAEDLTLYRDALATEEGRWFMETSRQALIEAIKPSIERFAENVSQFF